MRPGFSVFLLLLASLAIAYSSSYQDVDLIEIKKALSSIKLNEIETFLTTELQNVKLLDKYNDRTCTTQLLWITNGLKNGESWALKLFDSWAKPNAGYLSGNVMALGHYDQCLKFSHNHSWTIPTISKRIDGQHCNVALAIKPALGSKKLSLNSKENSEERGLIGVTNGIPVSFGICIPKTCNPEFFKILLDRFGKQTGLPIGNYNQTKNCNDGIDPELTGADIGAITFLSIIGGFILASTVYDVLTLRKGQRIELLLAFSFYTNLLKLFKTTPQAAPNKKSDVIGCLNGIRTLSMIWIVMAHRYTLFGAAPTINLTYTLSWFKEYPSMMIVAGTVAVDTFFLLSGFLVTRSVFKELDRRKFLNVPYMYLHRYLRLTPSLAILIFMQVTLYKYIGSGPVWKMGVAGMTGSCETNWWLNMLYIQNYYRKMEMCMGHSWYLAIDMQLYILSPLIIWPLWKFGKKFLPVVVGLLWFLVITLFTYMVYGKYRYSFVSLDDRMEKMYFATHTRYGPWLVGLLLAYLLYCQKEKEIKLHWSAVLTGWIICLATIGAVIFGIHPISQIDSKSQWEDTMYGTFSILAWSLSLSWIIWASINGYGGFINSFLSWTFWQPLARLTYSLYLLHIPIQFAMIASTRTNLNFSNVDAVYMLWGDLGFTLTVAIVWTLAFESPLIIIEKYIFGTNKTVQKTNGASEKMATGPSKFVAA